MNNKHLFKKAGVTLLALGMMFGATGCDFIVPNTVKDLNQTVATVDITGLMSKDTSFSQSVTSEVSALIQNNGLSTVIPKRDLVASFMSVGYTYINNYGMSYEQTFNTLMDGLANRKIMTQYAVAYYIQNRPETAMTFDAFKSVELANANDTEKTLIQKYPEVLTMKYYLTDYGKTDEASMEAYFEAVYGLQKSLNSTLDSSEETYIKASEHEHNHEESRVTPTDVNTETEEYLPMKDGKLDYDVYTGRNTLDSCGAYERIKGSSSSTRMSAYNSLLSNLQGYGLIKKDENTAVITNLEYYYQELSSALGQALINKYYEELETEAIDALEANSYAYVTQKYTEILEGQQNAYTDKNGAESFKTALDKLSDTSFLLYGLKDYGFVYNILLPFSDLQSQQLTALETKGLSQDALFNARKAILNKIEASDLRTAWFCEDEAEHYAYEVTENYYGATAGQKAYLFFEDNMTNTDKYKTLDHYYGQYPYQGTPTFNAEEDAYEFDAKKFNIDEFMAEMEGYINYAVGSDVANGAYLPSYDKDGANTVYTIEKDDNKVVDYSKFVYYAGQVNLTQTSAKDYFNPTTDAYKALSAVNELMFAFSTDTGCLNTYMGYVVKADKTDFVSEFEYAAQYVVKQGVGSYAVAPSQYGWHIIYCAYKYDGGEVYGGFNSADVNVEGTFSNMFYESLKAKASTTKATDVQTEVLRNYKDATTLYKKTYQDLLDIN